MTSTARAEQRHIVLGAAIGMAVVFVAIAVLVRASGQPWSSAAGVAALPTLFGGWYFGALLPLARQDFSDEPSAAVGDPAVADASSVEDARVEADAA